MNAIIDAGYPYEIAGLVLYVFFLYMIRKRGGVMYSQRTRILTIVAAIGSSARFHFTMPTRRRPSPLRCSSAPPR